MKVYRSPISLDISELTALANFHGIEVLTEVVLEQSTESGPSRGAPDETVTDVGAGVSLNAEDLTGATVRIRAASSSPAHRGIREKWDKEGTWLRPPLLIERALVGEGLAGLQLVEGRTRVGVLRGRYADKLFVADTHLAWVGRRNSTSFP